MSFPRLLLVFFCSLSFFSLMGQKDDAYAGLNHKQWGELLEQYVDDSGKVDYSGFKKDQKKLAAYLELLGNNPPADHWSKNRRLAYYINLYNAATVKLILDHYPVNSIRDIKKPWGRKWIKVENDQLSLNKIEHKILRKMDEPRIHFAINCASASCPKLLNMPFQEEKMDQQLNTVSRTFINDPQKNQISPGKVTLSPIFKWYQKDFMKTGALLDFIRQYSEQPINPDARVAYLKYDWSLNAQ